MGSRMKRGAGARGCRVGTRLYSFDLGLPHPSNFPYKWYMPRYAAIDIGSNSIRMAAAEVLPGSGMRVLASERVVTRLGESVFRNGMIAQEPLELTCTVLARMAQQYQKLEVVGV